MRPKDQEFEKAKILLSKKFKVKQKQINKNGKIVTGSFDITL